MRNASAPRIIHEPLFPFAWERARHISLILFGDDGRILALKKGHSLDIIHGYREWDDDTLEETAWRETREQANATLGTITIAAVLETPADRLVDVVYELIMTAFVQREEPHEDHQEHESTYVTKETFLKCYRAGDCAEMQTLIEMAEDYCVRRSIDKRKKQIISNETFSARIGNKNDF